MTVAAAEAGAYNIVWIIVGVLTIVGCLYVIRDRRATIYRDERDAERSRADTAETERDKLKATRELTPILERIAQSAELQQQTLDKLSTLNGSLGHMRDGLAEVKDGLEVATEALKLVAGMVISDLPVGHPRRRGDMK